MSQSRKRRNKINSTELVANPGPKAGQLSIFIRILHIVLEPVANPRPKAGQTQGKRTAILLTFVVLVLILAIVGIIGYPTYIAPFRRTIITVDDINIQMDYFLKRIKTAQADPIALLTQLTNDQLIKLGAPGLGISLSPQDIDDAMKSIYQGSSANASASISVSDPEFKAWYRQTLNESGLTDAEYRDIVNTEILRSRLQVYLADRMPTIAEQVHLYLISLETQQQAEKARARWAAGESFSSLAKELSLDKTSGDKGGEIGWFPKGGILTPQLESAAFELSTGNVSDPLPVISDQQQPDGSSAPTIVGYHLIMVTERAGRQLDDNALQVLRNSVVDTWLTAERKNHTIKWRGLTGDAFDSTTYAWINWQVSKSKPAGATGSSQQPRQP